MEIITSQYIHTNSSFIYNTKITGITVALKALFQGFLPQYVKRIKDILTGQKCICLKILAFVLSTRLVLTDIMKLQTIIYKEKSMRYFGRAIFKSIIKVACDDDKKTYLKL